MKLVLRDRVIISILILLLVYSALPDVVALGLNTPTSMAIVM